MPNLPPVKRRNPRERWRAIGTVGLVRIRYVLFNAYAMGGTVRTVINQANALCADHDVEIASVYRHTDQPSFAIDPRVKLVPLTDLRSDGNRTDLSAGRRLMKKTRRFRNRLPHRHDWRFRRWDPVVDLAIIRYLRARETGVLVTTRPGLNLLSARFAPRRLIRVAQDHMNLGSYKPRLRQMIIREYPRLDAVTVLTRRDLADYEQALAGTGVRLARIPNGVPAPVLPPAPLASNVLIAAGWLAPQKGFDLLLDAFRLVADRHPDWQLWIFGSGPQRAALTAQITRLELTGRAHLLGQTAELDERLRDAAIFVLSSRHEGLPMVLLEATAAGLPAVAFDCPTGPADVVHHGTSGLLIPPEDVPALAAGICELIEDRARLRAMGAAAVKESEPYLISTVRRDWERLFTDLVATRAGSS